MSPLTARVNHKLGANRSFIFGGGGKSSSRSNNSTIYDPWENISENDEAETGDLERNRRAWVCSGSDVCCGDGDSSGGAGQFLEILSGWRPFAWCQPPA